MGHQPARTTQVATVRPQPDSPLIVLLVLALAVLVAGCGGRADEGTAPAPRADAIHSAWVAAVRVGNTDAALALTDPELPERAQFARDAVSRMQDYLTSPASPTGALQDVTVDPVRDGVGRSVWQFAAKHWCYRAELVRRDAQWYVSRWGQTSVDCHE